MGFAAKLDDLGRPAWIALLVGSFFVFPPLALALGAYLIWSDRMGFCGGAARWQEKMQARMQGSGGRWGQPRSTGNWAFDEYREDTIRRLEDEQREFKDFLDRLRRAKDKTEFDQFMAEQGRKRDNPQPVPAQD